MKLGERTFGNTNMDYHFLRDNGVCAKTTMRTKYDERRRA